VGALLSDPMKGDAFFSRAASPPFAFSVGLPISRLAIGTLLPGRECDSGHAPQ